MFRFKKRIKIASGVHLNLGRRGVNSVSFGAKGFSYNVSTAPPKVSAPADQASSDDSNAALISIIFLIWLFAVIALSSNKSAALPILFSVSAFVLVVYLLKPSQAKPKLEKYLNSRGYVVLPDVNELEHRYIAMQVLGRSLRDNEVVHHINGRRTDNNIENLCLMDSEKHEHFHSWLRWKKDKTGFYPSFISQKRTLVTEYRGTLLENIKS